MARRLTFDVDWRRDESGFVESSEVRLGSILHGVYGCPHASMVEVRGSASGNGYHVRLSCGCGVACDLCRMVFDSPERFEEDLSRPEWTRGVLWRRKVYRKGGRDLVGEAGRWVRKP